MSKNLRKYGIEEKRKQGSGNISMLQKHCVTNEIRNIFINIIGAVIDEDGLYFNDDPSYIDGGYGNKTGKYEIYKNLIGFEFNNKDAKFIGIDLSDFECDICENKGRKRWIWNESEISRRSLICGSCKNVIMKGEKSEKNITCTINDVEEKTVDCTIYNIKKNYIVCYSGFVLHIQPSNKCKRNEKEMSKRVFIPLFLYYFSEELTWDIKWYIANLTHNFFI